MLPEVRQHLSNSEHLLSNSLAKLDRLPAYKSAVINHVQHLRNTHYAETDASAKSIAVMSDRELPEGLRFPSPNEEAALRAEKLIMQHEHHHMTHSEGKKYPPGVTPKSIQPNKSSAGAVDHAEHQNIDLPQPAQSHLATKTTEHPVHRSESHAIVVSYPKAVDSRPPESTEDIVVEIHLPTQRPTPLPTAVASDVGHALSETTASPKSKKAQIVTPAVLACLVFLVAVILVARCYVRRMRLRRAGYNLTVVEVDEVADTETTMGHGSHLPRLARGRLTTSALSSGGNSVSGAGGVGSGMPSIGVTSLCEDHDPVDPLARWQMNGYENPAYKFTEGGYIFSPAE
ncbi:hypothetical protein D915_002998 [Fasciola hepatica]|uniref:Uncharacterized protein n=1 Tax=Fasciola hepatica TaxID=6192 RepID=A0A4E0RC80_FASHE|nr:hypothetical protein D915_002998 [Fasciola hepatica]